LYSPVFGLRGGWLNRDTALRFTDYAVTMGQRLGDRVAAIATHNEPWCTAFLGHHSGKFAPGLKDPQAAVQVAHHLLLSHGLALQAMRAAGVKAPLGIVLNQSPVTPASGRATDRALAEREGLELTDAHWELIHFLRAYWTEHGVQPQVRVMIRHFTARWGAQRGSNHHLHEMFPRGGPQKQGNRLAGLLRTKGEH